MLLPASQQSSCLCGAVQPTGIISSHGTSTRSRPDPVGVGTGVANIRCSGHVWIEPAPVVRMGSNISINCLSTLGCSWAKFLILLNYSLAEGPLRPLNSSTVQLWLRDFQMPFGTVACLARCPNSEQHQLVCGTDVLAGCEYPPHSYGVSMIFKLPASRMLGGELQQPGLCTAGGVPMHSA